MYGGSSGVVGNKLSGGGGKSRIGKITRWRIGGGGGEAGGNAGCCVLQGAARAVRRQVGACQRAARSKQGLSPPLRAVLVVVFSSCRPCSLPCTPTPHLHPPPPPPWNRSPSRRAV